MPLNDDFDVDHSDNFGFLQFRSDNPVNYVACDVPATPVIFTGPVRNRTPSVDSPSNSELSSNIAGPVRFELARVLPAGLAYIRATDGDRVDFDSADDVQTSAASTVLPSDRLLAYDLFASIWRWTT